MGDDDIEDVRDRKRRERMRELGFGAPDAPVYLDGSQAFADTVTASKVVLVHFYANRGAGQRLHPVVESVARETLAAVAKVNVTYQQALAREQGIDTTPMLVLYVDGEPVEHLVGTHPKSDVVALVREYTR